MLRKQSVIQLIDSWIENMEDGDVSDILTTVLLIVRSKIVGMQTEDGWVPCDVDLPKKSGFYLTTNKNGDVRTTHFSYRGDCIMEKSEWGELLDGDIVAWKNCPEPYKKE